MSILLPSDDTLTSLPCDDRKPGVDRGNACGHQALPARQITAQPW